MENPDSSKKSASTQEQTYDNAVEASVRVDQEDEIQENRVSIGPIPEPSLDEANRRAVDDRRSNDRRRSARGLFEFRARRDNVDRRQEQRRSGSRFRLAFWRR